MSVRALERKSGRAWCRICPPRLKRKVAFPGRPGFEQSTGLFSYRQASNPTPNFKHKRDPIGSLRV